MERISILQMDDMSLKVSGLQRDGAYVRQEDGSWRSNRRTNISSVQRLLEMIIAGTALVVNIPVMAVLAVLIKLDSRGPVLFHHTRIGINGKPFTFIKLRSQYTDSKQRFPDLCAYDFSPEELSQVRLQVVDDPRVTRVGKWIRRTSLDELPNFWHVFVGDMALVGPRPEMWEMFRYYQGEMLEKFSVRPGITGLAQICGRGYLSFEETIRYDLEYINTRSWRLDVKILLKTVKHILVGDGAM